MASAVSSAGRCNDNTFLVELIRQEIDFVLVGRGFIPKPERTKLCQHLLAEGSRHLECQMASVAFKLDLCIIGLSLSKHGELHVECRKAQFRHFLIVPLRQKLNHILVVLKPVRLRRLGTQMLRQHRANTSTRIVPITSVRHCCTRTLQIRDAHDGQ